MLCSTLITPIEVNSRLFTLYRIFCTAIYKAPIYNCINCDKVFEKKKKRFQKEVD